MINIFTDLTPAIGCIKANRIESFVIMNTIDIYADNPTVTLEYMIAVMQAAFHLEPPTIEFRLRGTLNGWRPCAARDAHRERGMNWDWASYEYRISPNLRPKKTVPMERDDYPPFFWIQCNGNVSALAVLGVSAQGITIPNCAWQAFPADSRNGCNHYTWKQLSEHWQYSTDRKTWLPCTKEVSA